MTLSILDDNKIHREVYASNFCEARQLRKARREGCPSKVLKTTKNPAISIDRISIDSVNSRKRIGVSRADSIIIHSGENDTADSSIFIGKISDIADRYHDAKL